MPIQNMRHQRLDIAEDARAASLSNAKDAAIARILHSLLLRVALGEEQPVVADAVTRNMDVRIKGVRLLGAKHLAVERARLAQPHLLVDAEAVGLVEGRQAAPRVLADRPRALAEPPEVVVLVGPAHQWRRRQAGVRRRRVLAVQAERREAAVGVGLLWRAHGLLQACGALEDGGAVVGNYMTMRIDWRAGARFLMKGEGGGGGTIRGSR